MACKKTILVITAITLLAFAGAAFGNSEDNAKKALAEASPAQVSGAVLNCEAAIPIACGQTLAGTNVGAANQTSTYNCTTFSEGGGEAIYKLVLATQQQVTITMPGASGQPDIDLLLLSACDNTACIAGSFLGTTSTETITQCLAAGTYYIVVDGFSSPNAGRAFTLTVACVNCPPPCNAICSLANDLCAGATALPNTGSITIQQDLTGATCATNSYTLTTTTGCTGFTAAGRDVVYKINLAVGCVMCVSYDRCNISTTDFDKSIYLLNTCPSGTVPINVTANCVIGADALVTNDGPETFCYTATTAGTYYLVADAFGTNIGGKFTLNVTTTCPATSAEPTTWGRIKGIYQ